MPPPSGPVRLETVVLRGDSPGRSTRLARWRFGADAPPPDGLARRPKAYLQAALHADEQPGIMALHHLLPLLERAALDGRLRAEFVVAPTANPLGLGGLALRAHQGRHDMLSGLNFNRAWPDLFAAVGAGLVPRLGPDPEANAALAIAAVGAWLDSLEPASALDEQRLAAMREAHDADVVLDLHCDEEALPHVFAAPETMPEWLDLPARMGAAAVLTAEDSGGSSFDEVWTNFRRSLARAAAAADGAPSTGAASTGAPATGGRPARPVPQVFSATLEYRGGPDVSDALGRADAAALFDFFRARGWIADAPPGETAPGEAALRASPAAPLSEAPGETALRASPVAPLSEAPPPPPVLPFAACEILRAPAPGLVAFQVGLGDRVARGDVVAELIALDGERPGLERTPLRAGTDGLVLSRCLFKYAWRGRSVLKIAGETPLPQRGAYLLED